jgi:hypothetical protein
MSAASRPVSTGKTRTCPHCKATILESLSICPGCMHHLRFDSEAAKRQVAAAPALRVEGVIRHPPLEQPLEYFVIIAIRNDRGEEVTRQVVNVGALQAAEKRTFTLSVEVLPPQAPVATKSGSTSGSTTGTFKSPAPQPATARSPGEGATATGSPAAGSTSGGSAAAGSAAPQPPSGSAKPAAPAIPQPPVRQGAPPPNTQRKGPSGSNNPPGASNPPGSSNPAGSSSPAGSSNPAGQTNAGAQPGHPNNPSTGPANPAGSAASGQTKPGNPAAPSTAAKPSSGYVLKPPSPGGPKRH